MYSNLFMQKTFIWIPKAINEQAINTKAINTKKHGLC